VAELGSVARITVIAQRMCRRVDDPLQILVAHIQRTVDSIVHHGRSPRQTAQSGVAGLDAVAEQAVVAATVVGLVHHGLQDFTARVHGTGDAIVDGHSRSGKATQVRVAPLHAVAEAAVVAQQITGRMNHRIQVLITVVHRTGSAVVQHQRGAGSTGPGSGIAAFDTVAEHPIIADIGNPAADPRETATVIPGTGIPVIAGKPRGGGLEHTGAGDGLTHSLHTGIPRGRTDHGAVRLNHTPPPLTEQHSVAQVSVVGTIPVHDTAARGCPAGQTAHAHAVAAGIPHGTCLAVVAWTGIRQPHTPYPLDATIRGAEVVVLAQRILGDVLDGPGDFIAQIQGAGNPVGSRGRSTRLATCLEITSLGTVAVQAVITCGMMGQVLNAASRLVTQVHGAGHTVVQPRHGNGDAPQAHIALLGSVTEHTVITPDIVPEVYDTVQRFVAGIQSAVDAIIHHWRSSGDASQDGVTDLAPVAEQRVVAVGMARNVLNLPRHGVAHVQRTVHAVVQPGKHSRQTAQLRITHLLTVARICVTAQIVTWQVHDGPRHLVAEVQGAGDPVVCQRHRTRHTADDAVAAFRTVAEQTVVTPVIPADVANHPVSLVTKIFGANHPVTQDRRHTRNTTQHGIAGFHAITEHAVVAGHPLRGHARAEIAAYRSHRTGVAVVTQGSRGAHHPFTHPRGWIALVHAACSVSSGIARHDGQRIHHALVVLTDHEAVAHVEVLRAVEVHGAPALGILVPRHALA
jgi:hypothetical protein